MKNINIEKLRNDLIDYFTSAIFIVSPVAMMDIQEIEAMNDMEIIKMARDNKFDLSDYIDNNKMLL